MDGRDDRDAAVDSKAAGAGTHRGVIVFLVTVVRVHASPPIVGTKLVAPSPDLGKAATLASPHYLHFVIVHPEVIGLCLEPAQACACTRVFVPPHHLRFPCACVGSFRSSPGGPGFDSSHGPRMRGLHEDGAPFAFHARSTSFVWILPFPEELAGQH